MSRILIAGAGGYLGIPLAESLAAKGHEVIAADRWFFGKKPNGCQIITTDIRSVSHFKTVFSPHVDSEGVGHYDKPHPEWIDFKKLDAVVDLAGLSNDASADIDPELTLDINLNGACRLADMAKRAGVKKYVYSSSCSVYGHGEKIGLTEKDECNPITLYAECKVRVEDHLRSITDSGFQPVILRNATVFGVAPRMRFDLAVNIMTLRAWRDGRILVMGGGDQWRPFVHVMDVVDAMVWAVEEQTTADTFNVGITEHNLSIAHLANMVKAQVPSAKIETVPDYADKRSYNVSFWKLRNKHMLHNILVQSGIAEIIEALGKGEIDGDAPEGYTLQYYRSLMDWEKRLNAIRLDGRIL